MCALFTSGSALHIALLKALDALLKSPGSNSSAPICAAINKLQTTSTAPPPREQRAAYAFTQSQGSQAAVAQGGAATQSTSQPRFAESPSEADSVPPDAADAPAVMSLAMLQTLQVLTCALRAVKDLEWLALECTGELFAACADLCARQLRALHDSYQSRCVQLIVRQCGAATCFFASWLCFGDTDVLTPRS